MNKFYQLYIRFRWIVIAIAAILIFMCTYLNAFHFELEFLEPHLQEQHQHKEDKKNKKAYEKTQKDPKKCKDKDFERARKYIQKNFALREKSDKKDKAC